MRPASSRMMLRSYGLLTRISVLAFFTSFCCPFIASQTFTTLHSFAGSEGITPKGSLIQGTDGNFYGTTYYGGAGSGGTVFRITPDGVLTILHAFCSKRACSDGDGPESALVQAVSGEFYGTTFWGGLGGGTVLKFSLKSKVGTAHKFDNPSSPNGLIQGSDGNLYGTTYWGGSGGGCLPGYSSCGTVFKMTVSGSLTTLYNFCAQPNCADGGLPWAGLVQGGDGSFYGTTYSGGTYCVPDAEPCGTIFKVTPNGLLTTLYTFCSQPNCTDGAWPLAGLIQGADGAFYGTTAGSYAFGYGGTVFKITPGGTLTTLYNFCSEPSCLDGAWPAMGSLVQGTDGNFYGTTSGGGANGYGTVFEITPSGELTTLYSFCTQDNCTDGAMPYAGLLLATSGNFYGATTSGGTYNGGTIFSLFTGLAPFVEMRPSFGRVGSKVTILGNNLTHASAVSFNGANAKFKIRSGSQITATVPNQATTGSVTVMMPSGVLVSNTEFIVE